MPLIDEPNKASRLATAIVADVLRYNDAKVTAGLRNDDLSMRIAPEIAAARELFLERVDPSHASLFDRALALAIANRRAQVAKALEPKEETVELEIPREIYEDADAEERRRPARRPDLATLMDGKTEPLLSLAEFGELAAPSGRDGRQSLSLRTQRNRGGGLMIVGGLVLVGIAIALAVFILR